MTTRRTLRTYGERGRSVRVFTEKVRSGNKLVRVQWRPQAGALVALESDGTAILMFHRNVCRVPAQAMTVVSPYWAVQPVGP